MTVVILKMRWYVDSGELARSSGVLGQAGEHTAAPESRLLQNKLEKGENSILKGLCSNLYVYKPRDMYTYTYIHSSNKDKPK